MIIKNEQRKKQTNKTEVLNRTSRNQAISQAIIRLSCKSHKSENGYLLGYGATCFALICKQNRNIKDADVCRKSRRAQNLKKKTRARVYKTTLVPFCPSPERVSYCLVDEV